MILYGSSSQSLQLIISYSYFNYKSQLDLTLFFHKKLIWEQFQSNRPNLRFSLVHLQALDQLHLQA